MMISKQTYDVQAAHGAVLNLVRQEMLAQDKKWGDQSGHTLEYWYTILGEEYGEAGKEILTLLGILKKLREMEKAGIGTPSGVEENEYSDLLDCFYEVQRKLRSELIQVAAVATNFIIQAPEIPLEKINGEV